MTKEIIDIEASSVAADRDEVHLLKEGTFLRAYVWSAWLCCRYLHDFKVTKRMFKDAGQAVAFIGLSDVSVCLNM